MIRLAQEKDYDRMVEIWLEASIKAHNFIPAKYWEDGVSDMRTVYLPQSQSWVYEDEQQQIQGFASVLDNHIAALFVNSQLQGRGIGSLLIRFLKTTSRKLSLNVYADNKEAVDFYKKHGFQVEEETMDEATSAKDLVMNWTTELYTP